MHRRNSRVHLLCASAMLQLLAVPSLLTSASFQMTYGAMLGLYLVFPWMEKRWKPVHPMARRAWQVFAASLAVQLGILPAQLYWFGELPVFSIIVNMAVAGFISVVMLLYWLTLGVMFLPWIGTAFGTAAGQATRLMMQCIRALAELAGATLWVRAANVVTILGWALMMLALGLYLPRKLKARRLIILAFGCMLLFVSLIPLPHTGTEWMQFSVGDEDAGVLLDGPTVTVVDVGEDGEAVAKYLLRTRQSVDTLILTHLHSDHAGGVRALLNRKIPVERCCLPAGAMDIADPDPEVLLALSELEMAGTEIVYLSRGDVVTLPSGNLRVVWPVREAVRNQQDGNDSCLVLLAELHGSTMLLTGDLPGEYEMYCAEPVDILKAAHHGSDTSTSPEFLQETDPQLILLSNKDPEREAAFSARCGDVPVYSTCRMGTVFIHFRENGFSVETFLGGEK